MSLWSSEPNMPSRTALRRLASYVLAVWLFALGCGVVNACVISGELGHGVPDASVHQGHGMSGEDMAGHDMGSHDMGAHDMAAHAGHDHHGEHDKPPCERLCDAPAAARLADKELGSSLAGFWLAPAPLPTVALWVLPPATHAAPVSEQPWRATVPLPIAFQRLAL